MRPAEKPLVVHAPPDSDESDEDRKARRGSRKWKRRGRSESPPISTRSEPKKMPFEKIAIIHRNRDMSAIKSAFFGNMSDAAYERSRHRRLEELEQDMAADIDASALDYADTLKRSYEHDHGRPARGLVRLELERYANEVAENRELNAARVAAGEVVNRVPRPPEPTQQHIIDARLDETPIDNPPPVMPPNVVGQFFGN